jgi:hypothetical protein
MVEAGGSTYRLISWRLCVKSNQGLIWQLESADEEAYAIQVSNLLRCAPKLLESFKCESKMKTTKE